MAPPALRSGSMAFSSPLLQILFDVVEFFIRPFLFCVTCAAGPYLPTTLEKGRPGKLAIQKYLLSPLFILLCLLVSPIVMTVFLLRNLLHQVKRPFCVIVSQNAKSASTKTVFGIATANLCLLPEIFAKFNNLDKTPWRAMKIGEQIVSDQIHVTVGQSKEKNCLQGDGDTCKCLDGTSHKILNKDDNSGDFQGNMEVEVIAKFQELDFLCLQETFDRDCSKILISQLKQMYPWIVYDVGYISPRVNYCMLNSGLMFASRYEVLDVRFKPFSKSCGFCSIVSKGLLMAKVLLSRSAVEKNDVGYVFNTHLQAFQGDNPVVHNQLHEILEWTGEFRRDTADPDDKVVLDILCGDFNIDNMSPGELHLSEHELFEEYIDVCREKPGKDFDWTVGTEMRNALLHDSQISTPELMKEALEDPQLRQHYVIDADLESTTMDAVYNPTSKRDEHGILILSPVGGRRRIDVVLYRKQTPVEIQRYNFVTSLASLTDHIPVSATFQCHS